MRIATASESARHGADHAELTAVITRLHARMIATANRVLHDHDEARDAVQDAYLQAVRHLDQFDRRARLATWLHRVVVNAARMRQRARRRRPAEPLDVAGFVDESPSIETVVHRRQLQALVRRSLADVPQSHRAVLVMRDIEDGDPVQVAHRLRVTRNALKVRSHRARRALRVRLMELGVVGPTTRSAAKRTGERSRVGAVA